MNTGSGQRLWHHLDDLEYERRVDIVEKHYPAFIPVIALAQDGPEAGLRALGQYWNNQDSQQIRQAYQGFVTTVIHSSVDLLYSGDGLNYRDRVESFNKFEQACRSALKGKEPATITDLGQHVAEQCIMRLPDCSPDEQVQMLRVALLGDSTLGRTALSPALLFSEQSRIFYAGRQDGGDGIWQRGDLPALARNWAAEPKFLKEMSDHPSEYVRSMVLCNPMADPVLLRRALELFPYPSEFWAKVADEEGGSCDLPEWARDEIDEKGDQLVWADILTRNPMLSALVVTGVANQIAGHTMENDVWAGVLLHPSCPRSWLHGTYENSSFSDWPLLCLAANPNTPSDVLAQMALLDESQSINLVENLSVTMNEVLIGVAVNPTTSIESRAALAMLGNEQVNLALRATSSNVG